MSIPLHFKVEEVLKMHRSTSLALFAGAMLVLLIPQLAQAQAAGVARPGYQYYSSAGQSVNWLFNPQIQKELEVVPEQLEKLKQIRTEMYKKRSELYKSYREMDPSERQKKYSEMSKTLGEEAEKKIKEVLLETQLDRLRQIMLQMKLRNTYGSASALAGDDVAKALGLTDEQVKQLREKEQKIRADMQKKTQEFYKKLREEAREELLGVLSEEQRKKLEGLTGEKFEWQPMQRRGGQGGARAMQIEKKQ
jgi:hypothetical protein